MYVMSDEGNAPAGRGAMPGLAEIGRRELPDIAFIGLGNMGAALARRLLREHRLHVWDLDPAAVAALAAEGAVAANGLQGVAASGAEAVITCLPTSREVEDVLFGEDGVAGGLAPGAVVVDMTTGDPLATRALADRLAGSGIGLVDAPVSGGVAGAERGTVAVMVGASRELFERVRPVLEAISPNVFLAGDCGAGHAMKLVNNMISSSARIAVFEGLTLAVKAGIAPERFVEILSKGTGRGYVADTTLPRYVLRGRADQGFALALMHKDLSLATRLGQDLGVPLVSGGLAKETFLRALNELGDDADITQLVRLFERAAGVDVCEPGGGS